VADSGLYYADSMDWNEIFKIFGSVALGALGAFVVIEFYRLMTALIGVLVEAWTERKKRRFR
jgi:hypothetical protein